MHTREHLVEFIAAKHPSIRRARLPFEGANDVLFSNFADDDGASAEASTMSMSTALCAKC